MIKIDGKVIDIGSFPDGSMLVRYAPTTTQKFSGALITWQYENDREFVCLMYLVKHLRSHGVKSITLKMPYIPNARQDRVKSDKDVFTLKYFAELLNSLELDKVIVMDPHSSVSEALINNLEIRTPCYHIADVLDRIGYLTGNDDIVMFYPDEGAMKRYSGMIELPFAFGIKNRDWVTGKILGLDVAGSVDLIPGKAVLIVDDICSRGGTFYHSAKKLKELGAGDIYLFVSHCENTILEGELLDSGLIKKVFTTDSIFTKSHDKVEVLK